MNIPCANHVICNPCQDAPIANLSSEAPDVFAFRATGYAKPTPPLGTAFDALTCSVFVTSLVSAADAALLAQNAAISCVETLWTNPVNGAGFDRVPSGPVPPPVGNRGGASFPAFSNTAQTAEISCPDGSTYSFTQPAGTFFGRNQAAADQAAQSYALQQAQIHRLCLGDIPDTACAGVEYNQTVTATSQFLAVPPAVNVWTVSVGLPPGLVFNNGNISGTPTTPGLYDFIVSVTLPNGDTNSREFFFTVAGLTNANSLPPATIGTAYAAQLAALGFNNPVFSVTDEPLPDGLALNSNGVISGTPAGDAVSGSFAVVVRDAVTDFECSQEVSLTVLPGGLNFNALVWGAPTISRYQDGGGTGTAIASYVGHHFTNNFTSPARVNPLMAVGNVFASGSLTYTGPLVNCNLQFTLGGGPKTNGFEGGGHLPGGGGNVLLITQDGNPILAINVFNDPNFDFNGDINPGVYNYPFTVAAGVGSVLQVQSDFAEQSNPAVGPVTLNVDMVLTPFA